MNRNSPANYVEASAAESLNESRLFVSGVIARKSRLIEPTVIPRFAVSCDKELMIGLGELAKEFGARVHTHLAETKPEVRDIKRVTI
jgi:guanine deaminase